ncbi:MAG TPA: hypothetical protein P5191_07895 [Ruminococcus sp.]|nr:hypothetical protein [Ruminococcus sp.]
MCVKKSEYEGIYNEILKFADFVSTYHYSPEYIKKQTGISKYRIIDILSVKIKDDVNDENAERFKELLPKLKHFIETETADSDYIKLNGNDFYNCYYTLTSEFNEIKQSKLVELLQSSINKINKDYNTIIARLKAGDETIHSAIEDQINALNDQASEYECLLSEGHCYSTGEYDENDEPVDVYVELSDDEKKEYREKADELWNKISDLKKTQEILMKHSKITDYKERISLNSKKLYRRKLQGDRIKSLTEDQQKALLSLYFPKCVDRKGFLIPDHFGSGIRLISMKIGETDQAKIWAVPEYLEKYKMGDSIPVLKSAGKTYNVYILIHKHKRVFFKGMMKKKSVKLSFFAANTYSNSGAKRIMRSLTNASAEIKRKVFDFLKKEFYVFVPQNETDQEYYKLISEYADILSLKLPAASSSDYSVEQIYRVAYEICNESNGKYIFSNELVNDIVWKLKFKPAHWLFMMYVQSYFYKHNEIKSLLEYIENEKEKEKQQENEIDL